MKKYIRESIFAVVLLAMAGCSSVEFYDEKTGKDVGFLYYPPKPYLLIEEKESALVTSIVSLPDLSRPHRVKHIKGWGAAEMGFVVENGMINSFNSKNDTKGPETLGAIASLGTSYAAVETVRVAEMTAKLASQADKKLTKSMTASDLNNAGINVDAYIIKAFEVSEASLKAKVLPILEREAEIFQHEINTIKQIIETLDSNKQIDYKPLDPDKFLADVELRRKLAKSQADILKNASLTLVIYADNKAKESLNNSLILP